MALCKDAENYPARGHCLAAGCLAEKKAIFLTRKKECDLTSDIFKVSDRNIDRCTLTIHNPSGAVVKPPQHWRTVYLQETGKELKKMKELHGYKSRTAFMIGNGIEPSASAASSLHRWLKSGKDPEKWANYYNNKEHSKATPISIFIINGKEISGFKSALMELGFDRDELEKIAISARIWMKKNPEKTIFDFAEHRRQKDMARAEYQILRQQGYASDIVVNYYIWRKRHSDTKDNSAENYIITVKNRTSKSSIKQSLAEYGLSRHYRLCENWLKENPGKAVKDFANWYHMSRIITINGIEFTSISEALIYCGMKEHYHACQKYIERNYRDDWNTGFNNWHAKHI